MMMLVNNEVLLFHSLFSFDLLVASQELLLLLQLLFLLFDLKHRHQVLLILQRPFYLELQLDGFDPLLLYHSLHAFSHEKVTR